VRNPHQGKAQAVSKGVFQARSDFVLFMDMDMAMPLDYVGPFVRAPQKATRISSPVQDIFPVPHDSTLHVPNGASRRTFSLLVSTLLLPGIRDSQCGFKAFRREAALTSLATS